MVDTPNRAIAGSRPRVSSLDRVSAADRCPPWDARRVVPSLRRLVAPPAGSGAPHRGCRPGSVRPRGDPRPEAPLGDQLPSRRPFPGSVKPAAPDGRVPALPRPSHASCGLVPESGRLRNDIRRDQQIPLPTTRLYPCVARALENPVHFPTDTLPVYGAFPAFSKKKDPRERGGRQQAGGSEQAERLAQRAKGRTPCAMRFARGPEDPGAAAGHRGGYASSETRPCLMAKRTRAAVSWTVSLAMRCPRCFSTVFSLRVEMGGDLRGWCGPRR